ncbi:hypothetical protein ACQP2U_13695 [Nocardia sp. CA-084685]|uniref:hypothetical protein n=1 Tax=Nocardia sp. CA-084685 TaxID=3239970 RepID=UPI003D981022
MIAPARRITHQLPALRPYAADDSGYDPEPGTAIPDRDPVLDTLCGFDAIAALIVTTRPGRNPAETDSGYYPSFGNYYSRRSEPWWAKLATDPQFRTEVLGEVSDEVLGDAMLEVANSAQHVGRQGFGPWSIETEPVKHLVIDARQRHGT